MNTLPFCLLSTLILLLILPHTADCSGYRTFTDLQGREMQAKVISFSDNIVEVQRKDGLRTQVPIDVLSAEDQHYIRQLVSEKVLRPGILTVRFSDKELNESESKNGGIKYRRYEAHYEIILKNNHHEDLADLRVEYLMFKFIDEIAAKKRSAGEVERKKGTIKLPVLPARTEKRLATDTFEMLETALQSGYVWSGGEAGKARDSADRLDGIWIRVYKGDRLLLEESRPQSIVRKEIW